LLCLKIFCGTKEIELCLYPPVQLGFSTMQLARRVHMELDKVGLAPRKV